MSAEPTIVVSSTGDYGGFILLLSAVGYGGLGYAY
jgi:hypothetical protein